MSATAKPATGRKAAVFGVAAAATGVLVALSPEDVMLGAFVRFLYFHGALTWVNLATFTFAAIAAVFYLFRGTENAYRWASAFRYVSIALWAVNTWMGFESMRQTWGGIKWDEPRLAMTIWVMLAAVLLFGIESLLHRPKVTAVLDILLASGVWYGIWTVMLVTAENDFHPDSPIFNSGPEVIGFYLAMVVTSFVATYAATWLVKDRLAVGAVASAGPDA